MQAVSTSSMFGSIPVSAPSIGGVAAGSAAVNVKMPGQFATAMEQYQESFKKLAPMRRLRWLNARSSVLLELEMNDGRRIKERVTPLQAAVVELAAGINASRQQPLSLSLLQTELQVDNKAAIAEALTFWSAKGVLRPVNEDPTLYEIVEDINN